MSLLFARIRGYRLAIKVLLSLPRELLLIYIAALLLCLWALSSSGLTFKWATVVCLTAFGVGATCVWRLIKQYRGELIYDGQWWLRRESSGNVILDQSLEPSAAHIVHPNLLLIRFRGGLMTGPSTFWLSRLNVDVEQLRKLRVFVQTQRF